MSLHRETIKIQRFAGRYFLEVDQSKYILIRSQTSRLGRWTVLRLFERTNLGFEKCYSYQIWHEDAYISDALEAKFKF